LKELGGLKDLNLRTVRAYNIKLALQEFWKFEERETAEAYFKNGITWLPTVNFLP
jgi:transposase